MKKTLSEIKKYGLKGEKEPFSFDRFFSRYLTWLFLRMELSANQVTVLSLIVGCMGGVFYGMGGYISALVGGALVFLFIVLDSTDGEIARIRGQSSITGVYLESVTDSFVMLVYLMGFVYGSYDQSNVEFMLFSGVWLVIVYYMNEYIDYAAYAVVAISNRVSSKDLIRLDHINLSPRRLTDHYKRDSVLQYYFGLLGFRGKFFGQMSVFLATLLIAVLEFVLWSLGVGSAKYISDAYILCLTFLITISFTCRLYIIVTSGLIDEWVDNGNTQ